MWSSAYHSYVRQPWVQKLLRRVDRASEQREEAYRLLLMPLPWRGKPRIWLHGASLGELASLWPIVREGAGAFDFIVTAWSDSAARDLREHAHQEGVVFSGLSPMEGRWKRAIETIKPDVFVSMRYEAWPELWSSLNEVSVSLLQLAAQPRSSIRWASRLAPADQNPLSKRVFSLVDLSMEHDLKTICPGAETCALGDPRWDEIAWRANHIPQAMDEWFAQVKGLPRPWGVVGSAWAAEMGDWCKILDESFRGTLFVFPHDLSTSTDPRWPKSARNFQLKMVLTHGWLTMAYAKMDWAWVGGGFGKGVHSVLEPLSAGIPVVCGPRGMERFGDYARFQQTGQLTLCRTPSAFRDWAVEFLPRIGHNTSHMQYDLSSLRGATQRVVQKLTSTVTERRGKSWRSPSLGTS